MPALTDTTQPQHSAREGHHTPTALQSSENNHDELVIPASIGSKSSPDCTHVRVQRKPECSVIAVLGLYLEYF